MMRKLKYYAVLVVLAIMAIIVLFFVGKAVVATSAVDVKAEKRVEMTPAVIDSLRAIKQWELAVVPVKTVVDTVERKWMGIVKNLISKKYEGRISIGVDLQKVSSISYTVNGDTINLVVSDVCVLDSNFIDETKTEVLRSDNDDFERRKEVRRDMLERARQKMLSEGVSPLVFADCRRRAASELTERFRCIGYSSVSVVFK